MTWHVEHVTRTIRATPEAVALVAGDPAQLPQWAAGLSSGIRREGEQWITDSPMGAVEVRFTGPVEAGILDHDVILPDGTTVRNPFRVLSNDDGSEVVFSVFQRDGMSDDEFAADVRAVGDDLARLAGLVES